MTRKRFKTTFNKAKPLLIIWQLVKDDIVFKKDFLDLENFKAINHTKIAQATRAGIPVKDAQLWGHTRNGKTVQFLFKIMSENYLILIGFIALHIIIFN